LPNPENVNEVDSANPQTGKIETSWAECSCLEMFYHNALKECSLRNPKNVETEVDSGNPNISRIENIWNSQCRMVMSGDGLQFHVVECSLRNN
jgi:hypothetical protein